MKNALITLGIFCFVLCGCTQTKTTAKNTPVPLGPINSLPQKQLSEYNDDFSLFRNDLWEKSYHLFREDAKSRFAAADAEIHSGQLLLTTKKGSLSSVNVFSNFLFEGDFDVQTEVFVDFDTSIPMRQMAHFGFSSNGLNATFLLEKEGKGKIGLKLWKGKVGVGSIRGTFVKRIYFREFSGSLRAVRRGAQMTFYYRDKLDSDWQKLYEYRFTADDAGVGFGIKNFYVGSSSNPSPSGVSAVRYDNFKINAAENVIERDEI